MEESDLPSDMSKYEAVSDELREQVKIFTLCAMPPKTIAATLEITPTRVSRVQQSLGLNPRPFEKTALTLATVRKILELYKHHGAPFISRKLGVTMRRVYMVIAAHGGGERPPKRAGRRGHSRVAEKQMQARKRLIQKRRDAFERQIAAEFGVSLGWVRVFLRRRRT